MNQDGKVITGETDESKEDTLSPAVVQLRHDMDRAQRDIKALRRRVATLEERKKP